MGKPKKETPPTYEVRLSENAIRNIDEIAGYIAFVNHQPINAEKVVDSIFEVVNRIKQNPYAFKECSLLATKGKLYRQAVCHKWLIIYRVVKNNVLVLGIVHGSRRPSEIRALKKVQ